MANIKYIGKDTVTLECGFFQPSEIRADGLANDMNTMPILTLGIRNDSGKLVIEETEYTSQYLKE